MTKKSKTQIKIKKKLIYVVSCLIVISVGFVVWWNSKWENHFDYVGYFDSGRAQVILNGKSGFVDSSGKIIIPLKYLEVLDFNNGIAWVNLNNKWGVIDYNGHEITPPRYDFVDEFHLGRARVKINNKWGLVDSTGKEVVLIKYDKIDRDEYYMDIAKVELNGKWFYIDNDGNITKHPIWKLNYDYVYNFVQGIARVSYNGKWGYVNKSGKEIIPLKYDYIGGYYNGLARVEIASKWGVIDKSGTVKIPIKYDHIVPLAEDFPSSGLIECSLNSKYIFIDCNGNIVKTETFADKIERISEQQAKMNSINSDLKRVNVNLNLNPESSKKLTVGRYDRN